MTKKRLKINNADTEHPEPTLEELQQLLEQKKQENIQKAEAEIEAVMQKYGLSIGNKLNAQRLADVINYMIQSKQDEVSLKFEIW